MDKVNIFFEDEEPIKNGSKDGAKNSEPGSEKSNPADPAVLHAAASSPIEVLQNIKNPQPPLLVFLNPGQATADTAQSPLVDSEVLANPETALSMEPQQELIVLPTSVNDRGTAAVTFVKAIDSVSETTTITDVEITISPVSKTHGSKPSISMSAIETQDETRLRPADIRPTAEPAPIPAAEPAPAAAAIAIEQQAQPELIIESIATAHQPQTLPLAEAIQATIYHPAVTIQPHETSKTAGTESATHLADTAALAHSMKSAGPVVSQQAETPRSPAIMPPIVITTPRIEPTSASAVPESTLASDIARINIDSAQDHQKESKETGDTEKVSRAVESSRLEEPRDTEVAKKAKETSEAAETAAPAKRRHANKKDILAKVNPPKKNQVEQQKHHAKKEPSRFRKKESPEEGDRPKHRSQTSNKRLLLIAFRDAFIALALLVILLQFFSPTVVRDHSMEDTLKESEIVYIAKKAYWFGDPQYNDIVIFQSTLDDGSGGHKTLVKRIIGLPGDRISIRGSLVFRNGSALEETYVKGGRTDGIMDEVVVPDDSYFVLGDNRAVSNDSRSASVGFVSRDQLTGKALLRIFPLDKITTF